MMSNSILTPIALSIMVITRRDDARIRWILLLLFLGSGCGPTHRIRRIAHEDSAHLRVADVRALGRCHRSAEALTTLIALAKHERPAIRYFALEALEELAVNIEVEESYTIYKEIVDMLDDTDIAGYTQFPPFSLTGYTAHTGSIRARALLALTERYSLDYGFDKGKWLEYIELLQAE